MTWCISVNVNIRLLREGGDEFRVLRRVLPSCTFHSREPSPSSWAPDTSVCSQLCRETTRLMRRFRKPAINKNSWLMLELQLTVLWREYSLPTPEGSADTPEGWGPLWAAEADQPEERGRIIIIQLISKHKLKDEIYIYIWFIKPVKSSIKSLLNVCMCSSSDVVWSIMWAIASEYCTNNRTLYLLISTL